MIIVLIVYTTLCPIQKYTMTICATMIILTFMSQVIARRDGVITWVNLSVVGGKLMNVIMKNGVFGPILVAGTIMKNISINDLQSSWCSYNIVCMVS